MQRCKNFALFEKRNAFSFSSQSLTGDDGPWTRKCGEGALLLRFGTTISTETSEKVLRCMDALERSVTEESGGIIEVLPAYASLMVRFDPLKTSHEDVEAWCLDIAGDVDNGVGATPENDQNSHKTRTVSIPVCYGGDHGPDLEAAADAAGLTSGDAVAKLHSEASYRVYFLGFTGGFPYLGGLPEELITVPRLSTPRQNVKAGAVGIAAGQTGVYTLDSPGGWHLLGKTPVKLFDPSNDPPAVLRPGDTVEFLRVTKSAYSDIVSAQSKGEADALPSPTYSCIEIVAPGPMAAVQDEGRDGHGRYGVSRSGAADNLALRTGNLLLGNDANAAGIEIAMGGLKVKCVGACSVALTGADCRAAVTRNMLQGAPPEVVSPNEIIMLQPGDELKMGYALDGARAYLCVRGGIDVPQILGSRSTDIKARLGGYLGRILKEGDVLGRGNCKSAIERSRRALLDPLRDRKEEGQRVWRLRILPGPGDPGTDSPGKTFCADSMRALIDAGSFSVTPRSDRMAICVSQSDDRASPLVGGQQMSEACVSGTIQIPPDGNPVILLAEHQTTGGYKVPAVVIQADMWKVGQMKPGDELVFVETTQEEAVVALKSMWTQCGETENALAGPKENLKNISSAERVSTLYALGHQSEAYWNAILEYTEGNMGITAAASGVPSLVPRSGKGMRRIDLNADCGEGFDDVGLMEYITSANIACGGHVGTPDSISRTVHLAASRGVRIGAHVSFPDRDGFGRKSLIMPPSDLRDQVLWQAGALAGVCKGANAQVSYIKPHGALYHAVMEGGEQGKAVFDAARHLGLPLLLMPRSPWATFGEGFAERMYDGDKLRSRDKEGAVIHDPVEAATQALNLAMNPRIHTICVHGDSPNAVSVAKEVRRALDDGGYSVAPFIE